MDLAGRWRRGAGRSHDELVGLSCRSRVDCDRASRTVDQWAAEVTNETLGKTSVHPQLRRGRDLSMRSATFSSAGRFLACMLNIRHVPLKVVCAAIVLTLSPALADASSASGPALFRLHWRLVARNVIRFATDGRYVFFDNGPVNVDPGETGTLIDDQTGKRISLPGCTDPMFGGPWLALDCANAGPSGLSLYQLSTGHRKRVHLFWALLLFAWVG